MVKERKYWASIKTNKDFIHILTRSGYSLAAPDYEQKNEFLEHGIADKELGAHIREALSLSRWVHPKNDFEIDQYLFNSQRYKDWIEQTMQRFGYKTKSKLFTPMLSVTVTMEKGSIEFMPWHQTKMTYWEGTGKNGADYVVIPADSSDEEIGAAARLALSRCSSKSHYDPILEKLAKHD